MALNQHDGDHIIARLSMFVTCILALILMLIFMGCGIPQRDTDTNPFPKPGTEERFNRWHRQHRSFIGINQQRCFGGGIGGCTMGGKAYDGPAGSR